MTHTVNGGGPGRPVTEQSTGELVQHASEQFARLIREELALARAEFAEKGRRAGRGAGLLGGGGFLALYGLGALVLAAILGLAVVMPGWLAALIIGVAILIIAGLFALIGREQVRSASPPMPSGSAESLRADLDTVTKAVRERGATAGTIPTERELRRPTDEEARL
ncbi:phage holin family protein [Natronosporangium hydrolyticum]|uniref:Phage holin family protein n=1 Tax=Natronosporangium hydrolyticum TaxID=2811111 RepID=A0A895YSC7_9ACTN|nr:phage holin family protein [Natronosporangium hydrolyticum]QSB16918.1 phage holin family protein [Natronosporangium hydrolyticum]